MQSFEEWLRGIMTLGPLAQQNFLLTLLVALLLWLVRRLVLRVVFSSTEDPRVRYQWQKTSGYVTFLLGVLLVGRIWYEGFQSLATFLGLLSAGVVIALKDLLVNLAGWGFILWRRPFETGDRVQIGNNAGDVIDLRIFQFTLLEIGNWVDADQSTGRIIHVPNGAVFTEPLANYSKGFQYIWDELPVLITFESNWQRAKTILLEMVARHAEHLSAEAQQKVLEASRKFMIFYSTLTPTVYTSVKDSGVLLTLRYLCEPRRRRHYSQILWEDILREFARSPDIDFAYPTRRFYSNTAEGKPGTGGPPPRT